jgi:subtilase family serine protease
MDKRARLRAAWPVAAVAVVMAGSLGAAGLGTGIAAASPNAAAAVGTAPTLPAGARVLGPAAGSTRLKITVVLHSRDGAGLEKLAQQVGTPSAARFRHFLSPRQVQDRFGPSAAALSALRSWLRSHHLSVGPALGDGLLVPATGTVRELEAAFRTPIRLVRLAGGRVAHANRRAPRVPAALRPSVLTVAGLDNLVTAEPKLPMAPASDGARRPAAGQQACAGARDMSNAFTAGQVAHAYQFDALYRGGDLGGGVTVALFELADYADSDIRTYERCYGISPSVSRVRVDGGTTIAANPAGTGEATADIETVAGLAPRARILAYEAPSSLGLDALLDNYGEIEQQDRAQIVSSSYGICESRALTDGLRFGRAEAEIFQEMAVQGQSMMAASGDAGSEQCLTNLADLHASAYQLAIGDPAGQPFVTAVGGTAIVAYGSPPTETVWNESGPALTGTGFPAPFDGADGRPSGFPGNLVGSGGISSWWRMPSWQRGFDTSGNSSGRPCGAPQGTDCREVPDVSALAAALTSTTPGYAIYGTAGEFGGRGWVSSGGTSLATPLWAALTALADRRAPRHRLGLLSPALYRIDRLDPATFSDVTAGDNNYLAPSGSPSNDTCTYHGLLDQTCYEATPGYDMATGLGSPRAAVLVSQLLQRPASDRSG